MTDPYARARAGLFLGLGAYTLWGVMPLYFKTIDHVPPIEIVAHRIVWSLFFLGALATLWKKWPAIRAAISDKRTVLTLALTAILVSINWLVYVYAVMSDHVLEASLGYYINPLLNILLGVFVLKEKLSPFQKASVLLAAAGVAVLAIGAGDGIWITLTLAASFSLYGILRKLMPVEAVEGLTIETLLLTPLALGWIIWVQVSGQSGFRVDPVTDGLLILGGVITAIPLLLFNAATRRLSYSTMGFIQYIAPSIQFLLAILLFGEKLTVAHIICFGAIWTAIIIFAVEGVRGVRDAARDRAAATP